MRVVRKAIIYLSVLMGVWVTASFIGVMFNTANVEFWTTSLIWSLLASIFLMPGFLVAYHMSRRPAKRTAPRQAQSTTSSTSEQPPFVKDEEREDALWPEPEKTPSVEEEETRR